MKTTVLLGSIGNTVNLTSIKHGTSQVALVIKNPHASAGDLRHTGSIPGSGRSPEGRAWQPTWSWILTWKIPWTEELSRLWSIGLQRVRHD